MDSKFIDELLKASGSRRESVLAVLEKHGALSSSAAPQKKTKKAKAKE